MEQALAMEAAKKSAAEAHGSDATVCDVHKVQAVPENMQKLLSLQFAKTQK